MALTALRPFVVPVLAGATCFAAGYNARQASDQVTSLRKRLGIQDQERSSSRAKFADFLPWTPRVVEDVDDEEEDDELEPPAPIKDRKPMFSTFDTIFSFAPNDGYFMATRTRTNSTSWSWTARINPSGFTNTQFTHVVDHPYWYAVSPHGDEMIAYKDSSTGQYEVRLHHLPGRSDQAPSYSSLQKWAHKHIELSEESLMKSQVVFGPGASYFVKTAQRATWHDIPAALESVILEQKEKYQDQDSKSAWIPRVLALGAGSSYVAIWDDGRYCFSLANNIDPNGDLSKDKDARAKFESFVLSPFHREHHLIVKSDGAILYNRNGNSPEFNIQAFQFMQMRAREEHSTFSFTPLHNQRKTEIKISPRSNWTEEKFRKVFSR